MNARKKNLISNILIEFEWANKTFGESYLTEKFEFDSREYYLSLRQYMVICDLLDVLGGRNDEENTNTI